MTTVLSSTAEFATGLVPVLPAKSRPIDEDRALLEIRLLRRKQLRRADVREKLVEYATRREVAR